jgi:hypothetical protein
LTQRKESEEPGRPSAFTFLMPFVLATFGMMSVGPAQAQEITAPVASNEAKPLEVIIVSTEFKYVPAKVQVPSGRAVTLVLDNSMAETEHWLYFACLQFSLGSKGRRDCSKEHRFRQARGIRIHLRSARPPRGGHEGHADRRRSLKTIGCFSLRATSNRAEEIRGRG